MKENALKIYLDEISQLKQAILGHVELVAIEPLQIFCLTVAFSGLGTIHAVPQNGQGSKKAGPDQRTSSEVYVHYQKYLMGDPSLKISSDYMRPSELKDIQIERMELGIHKYSFEFYLPANLPNSFDGGNCSVEYFLEAVLFMPQSTGDKIVKVTEISASVPIHIRGLLDLNQVPDINEESEGTNVKKTSCILCQCFSKKSVELTVCLRRRGYVSGEHVPFLFHIINRSGEQVLTTEAKLIQYIKTFPLNNEDELFTKRNVEITTLEKTPNDCERSEEAWMETIEIPVDAPVTHLGGSRGSKIIDVQYGLQITVTLSGWSKTKVSAEVPIIVGSIPLRKPSPRLPESSMDSESTSSCSSCNHFPGGDPLTYEKMRSHFF